MVRALQCTRVSQAQKQSLRDISSPGNKVDPGASLSSFCHCTQLFLNHQPFLSIKDATPLSPVPQQPVQQVTEENHRPTQGKWLLPLFCSLPPPESQSPWISATETDTGPLLFRGLCLWWFLLSIISLYIAGQLAGSHLILTGLEILSAAPEKPWKS